MKAPRGRPFQKGKPRPANAGRKKGSPNKLSATIKEEIEKVYMGLGGTESLLEWARGNKDAFYGSLLPRIIPKDLTVTNTGTVELVMRVKVVADRRAEPSRNGVPDTASAA